MQQDIPDDYVLASGESHSVREFLDAAFAHIGVDNWSNIVMQDPQFMRPSEVPHLCGRATKAKKALGWENEISFKELVAEMVDSDLEKT
jgi:GDPmannose 4,6-dehydratase